jgi:hypothetical protein
MLRVEVGEIGTINLGSVPPPGKLFGVERRVAVVQDRLASFTHQVQVEGQVVEAQERGAKHLVGGEQVVQVRPRKVRAAIARAIGLQGPGISPMFGIA